MNVWRVMAKRRGLVIVASNGERVTSVRAASQQHNLSVTTVVRAYELLESRGIIESHPQSGYFVRKTVAPASAFTANKLLPPTHPATQQPHEVGIDPTSRQDHQPLAQGVCGGSLVETSVD